MKALLPLALLIVTALPAQTVHHLKASAKTVVVGYYDPSSPPALRVKSGDIVEIETLGVSPPERWLRNGLPPDKVEPARIEIADANPNPLGGHYLTAGLCRRRRARRCARGADSQDHAHVSIRVE